MTVSIKPAAALVLLAFFHAAMIGPVALSDYAPDVSKDSPACIVVFDVCGHAGQSAAVPDLEFTACVQAPALVFPDIKTAYPPQPEAAVASACPGGVYKPPKAARS